MLRFLSLSSGSCGNCYFLSYKDDKVEKGLLIDAGVSLRRIKQCFQHYGLNYGSFKSILLTHDHMDHIRNIGSYCKHLNKPVYATETLHNALAHHVLAVPHIHSCRRVLTDGDWNDIDGFKVKYFVVPHDATQTVGYFIMVGEHKFVIMTDIGSMTDEALEYASQADTVVIESNYDRNMLFSGPYSEELKMRISQGNGHLSNDQCAEAIKRFWHPGLKNIFLCHLSENNNTQDKAHACSMAALKELKIEEGTVRLQCLPRQYPSQVFYL